MSAIGSAAPPVMGETYAYMSFARADAQPFDLLSLQLSEYSSVLAGPVEIRFVGTTSSGTVEQLFVADGVNDGAGPLADFELVLLGGAFANLKLFEIFGISQSTAQYAAFAVDDVSFVLAPEPGTAMLLGMGLAALAQRRHRAPSGSTNET
jgi:hypothetical protein